MVAQAMNGPHYLDELKGPENMQQVRVAKWYATSVEEKRRWLQLARIALAQVDARMVPAILQRPTIKKEVDNGE
jgi:hypothetical protein